MSGFSLWSDPWIPVQPAEGPPTKVSLSLALTEAHSLRGIADSSPLITVALHRLLLALLYRTHRLNETEDWLTLWQAGRFDAAALAAYGERWAGRFDLLHPTHPFYQVDFMAEEKVHSVAALALEAASGNNPALFDHGQVEGATELPLDRAACYLLAHQLFAIGGGVSKPFNRMDAPLTKGVVVEVAASTLYQTLMLNAMPMEQWRGLVPQSFSDRPFWEEEKPPEPVKEGSAVNGPLHYLTWQSRRIHLHVDRERRVVTGCQIAQRYCLPKDGTRFDPGKAYFLDEKKESGFLPRRLQKDRAAWRLTHVLLESSDGGRHRPRVVDWLEAVKRRAKLGRVTLPAAVSLSVSGLTTDPKLAAKIDLWRREEIGLPLAVLEDDRRIAAVKRLMNTAVRVESHLRRTGEALAWALAERNHQGTAIDYLWSGKTGNVKMPPGVAQVARGLGLTMRFWAAMEGPFRQALWRLAEEETGLVEKAWHGALKQNARAAMAATREGLKASGEPWEPLSLVDAAFDRRLAWVLENAEGEERDDDSDDD